MFETIPNIVLKVSNTCNLECSYCFESDKLSKNLFTDYKSLYSFIMDKIPLGKELVIKFTGGEPFLGNKNIKDAVKILSKIRRYKNLRLSFGVTTNAYYPDLLNYFTDRKLLDSNYCRISWDGIHSSDTRIPRDKENIYNTMDNMKKIHSKNILVRIALTKETIDYLPESVEWLFKNGFKHCEYYYIFNYPYYRHTLFRSKAYSIFKKLYDIQLKYLNTNRIENIWTVLYANNYNKFNNIDILCSHIGNLIYIDGNGDIYPCQFFSEDTPYMNQSFKIGSVYSGFDKDSINKFKNVWEKMSLPYECASCGNKQCFECPAVNLFKNKKRLMYECKLRDYERIIYSELSKYFNG